MSLGRAVLLAGLFCAGCASTASRPWSFTTAPEGRDGLGAVPIEPSRYRLRGFYSTDRPVRLVWTHGGALVSSPGAVTTLDRFVLDAEGLLADRSPLGGDWGTARALAFGADGRMWLAAAGGSVVVAVDPQGKASRLPVPPGSRVASLVWQPGRERLWGVDSLHHRLLCWDPARAGEPPSVHGARGSGPGLFHYPIDLALTEDESLLVVDSVNRRVQELDPDGAPRRSFPEAGAAPLARPLAVAVDRDGGAWVLDEGAGVIRGLSGDAAEVRTSGTDFAIDGNGNIWVASPLDGRIYLYELRRDGATSPRSRNGGGLE